MSKLAKSKDYVKRLLQDCKSWQVPCLSCDELMVILKKHPERKAFIVKTEMAYYAHIHKADKIARPDLFRLSGISHDEKLENLSALLTDAFYDTICTKVANLPTNQDLLNTLNNIDSTANDEVAVTCLNTGEMLAIAWKIAKNKYHWYIGYLKEQTDDFMAIDHLELVTEDSNVQWRYPLSEDIHTVENGQVLQIKVDGEWDSV